MDCLCNKNISWRGMMHACSAFIVVVNIRINKIKFKAVERLLL